MVPVPRSLCGSLVVAPAEAAFHGGLTVRRVLVAANKQRQGRAREELWVMKPLVASWLAAFDDGDVRVSERSTIAVKRYVYSVPSRRMAGVKLLRCSAPSRSM